MALVKQYSEGDSFVYQGVTYTIERKIFKVNNIIDKDKQIVVDLINNHGQHIIANFWKSELGKNPNIYEDNGKCKLAEIKLGDTIESFGFEYLYGNQKQFNPIGGYRLLEEPIVYEPPFDGNKYMITIRELLSKITIKQLQDTCDDVLSTYFTEFVKKPAASGHHHNYTGGLLQHTAEVMSIAYNMASGFDVNLDYIVVGAFFHDMMKIREYSDEGAWQEYGSLIGHVVGSADLFKTVAVAHEVPTEAIHAIYHIILSHHGKKEYGSPVEPQTAEAIIVHEADMVSSYINPIEMRKLSRVTG